jgi:hypothetical protein
MLMAQTLAGLSLTNGETAGADYGKWLLHGPQGAGKTTLASTVAEMGKTLFLDMAGERGTRSFANAPYSKNIDVARPTSVTDLDDVYWALAAGGHGYSGVIIDSLTSVQKQATRFLTGASETAVKEIRMGTAPATIQTWGQSLDIMTDIATFWFGLADATRAEPMHVVMTAQTKITPRDENNPVATRIPDVQKGALSIVLASPDYILYCDTEDTDTYDDDGNPERRHIVRFGNSLDYRTKARLPYDLRGKIPPILGRKSSPSLAALSRVLRVGGATGETAK